MRGETSIQSTARLRREFAPALRDAGLEAGQVADELFTFGEALDGSAGFQSALVTSGTATLETALFRVPQVVCYYLAMGKVISFLRKHILKVKYISLVNLVANKEVVRELVADIMTVDNVRSELDALLNDADYRGKMLQEYDRMIKILGPAGASRQAASKMIELLKR